jgi:hypothetical protein
MNCYRRGGKLSWPKFRQLPGGTEENYEILKKKLAHRFEYMFLGIVTKSDKHWTAKVIVKCADPGCI